MKKPRTAMIVLVVLVLTGGLLTRLFWPEPRIDATTTNEPPPEPSADQPPARPTTPLWHASGEEVYVQPGGYVVVVDRGLIVRDLFTGEVRWRYQDRERPWVTVTAIVDDRVVGRFSDVSTYRSDRTGRLGFAIPTGEQLPIEDVEDVEDLKVAVHPPGSPNHECDREHHDDETNTTIRLRDCDRRPVAVGLDPSNRDVRWRTRLPLGRTELNEIYVTGAGHGRAMVMAAERLIDRTNEDLLFELDAATGQLIGRLRLKEHFALGKVDPDGVAVLPEGFCAWNTWVGDAFDVACFDAGTGDARWSRYDAISSYEPAAVAVRDDRTLLLVTDDSPSRWVGYRLSDGLPLFDLDQAAPYHPTVAYHDHGVLALVDDQEGISHEIAVYGEAS